MRSHYFLPCPTTVIENKLFFSPLIISYSSFLLTELSKPSQVSLTGYALDSSCFSLGSGSQAGHHAVSKALAVLTAKVHASFPSDLRAIPPQLRDRRSRAYTCKKKEHFILIWASLGQLRTNDFFSQQLENQPACRASQPGIPVWFFTMLSHTFLMPQCFWKWTAQLSLTSVKPFLKHGQNLSSSQFPRFPQSACHLTRCLSEVAKGLQNIFSTVERAAAEGNHLLLLAH